MLELVKNNAVAITLPDAYAGLIEFNVYRKTHDSQSNCIKLHGRSDAGARVIINVFGHKIEASVISNCGVTIITAVSIQKYIYLVYKNAID